MEEQATSASLFRPSSKDVRMSLPLHVDHYEYSTYKQVRNLLTASEANGSGSILSKINGRTVRPANDISIARAWLDECLVDYSECRATRLAINCANETEWEPFFPTRLIDIGHKKIDIWSIFGRR
jgi:hypothetical protein